MDKADESVLMGWSFKSISYLRIIFSLKKNYLLLFIIIFFAKDNRWTH